MTDVRCPICGRLLFRVSGVAIIEIVCPKCGAMILWPNLSPEILNEKKVKRIEVELKERKENDR